MAYLSVGVRCLLALVFAVSVVSKVRGAASFRAFVDSLDATRLLPRRATGPTAVVLVAAEATAAALLGPPATARVGLALAALTLAAFAGAIAMMVRAGVRTPCRCFGASRSVVGRGHAVRNGLLAAGAALAAFAQPPTDPSPAGLAIALAGGLAPALLVVRFDDVIHLFARS